MVQRVVRRAQWRVTRVARVLLVVAVQAVVLLAPAVGEDRTGRQGAGSAITGRWLGQVAKDQVGPYSHEAPDGIQDICIALTGLPRARTIAYVKVSGDGGSEWRFNGEGFRAAVVRQERSPQAALLLHPDRQETGRAFFIHLRFDDGSTADLTVSGGTANPALRMPGAKVEVKFLGNTGEDLVGPTPAVGPDGLQDIVLEVWNLPKDTTVTRAGIKAANAQWETGLNPEGHLNAELVPDGRDATRGRLHLQAPRTIGGMLEVALQYANGSRDEVKVRVGRHSSSRPVDPAPTPALAPSRFAVRWHGQDGRSGGDRGDIHVSVTGLPAGKTVVAAGLSDAAGGYWAWKVNEQVPFQISQWDRGLKVEQDVGGGRLALFFGAFRDEKDARMSLWLLFDDGRMTVTEFAGESCDPFLYGQAPADSRIVAKPGDDLHMLAMQHGTIELTPGVYALSAPLELPEPVTISGPREAIVEFSHDRAIPWAAAIKIHRSNTTLRGFTVRFATPVVWQREDLFVPTVIGTTDRGDTQNNDPKRNITIEGMRIESPASADLSVLEECPRILHFASALSGRIIGNELRGGITEFVRGPWIIRDNTYLGCPEGFWVWDVFSSRWTHDIVVENNHLRPLPGSGKTWRFLVFASYGFNNVVRNNIVENIGIRDDDTIPNPNAAEIVLTEAYTVKFEGRPAALREGGRIVQLPLLHADAPRSGDGLAILNGPHAGKWVTVAQAITPTTLLLDQPLPAGEYDISVATGFLNLVFEGNRIDSTGSSVAGNLILVGNHFGTVVRKNHLISAGAFKLASCPTERPNMWGWTHCPYVGDVTEENIFEDSGGAVYGVEHGRPIKTYAGRTYRHGIFRNNVFRYTAECLDRRKLARHEGNVVAMTVSDPPGLDALGTVATFENNRAEFPAGRDGGVVALVRTSTIDGKPLKEQAAIPIPVSQPKPGPHGEK